MNLIHITNLHENISKMAQSDTAHFVENFIEIICDIKNTSLNDDDKRKRAMQLHEKSGISLLKIHKLIF